LKSHRWFIQPFSTEEIKKERKLLDSWRNLFIFLPLQSFVLSAKKKDE